MKALEKYKNSIHRKEIQTYDKLFFAMDAIEELEQQNTALKQERSNMQTTHRNTIARLQARIKELEEPKTCYGCIYDVDGFGCSKQSEEDCFRLEHMPLLPDYYEPKQKQ